MTAQLTIHFISRLAAIECFLHNLSSPSNGTQSGHSVIGGASFLGLKGSLPANRSRSSVTDFLHPFVMGVCAQAARIGINFSAECQNCRKMLKEVGCRPEECNRVLTPESWVLYLPEDAITACAEQTSNYASEMTVIGTEVIARLIRALADRADMILVCINNIPLSYGEIVKSQMTFTSVHTNFARPFALIHGAGSSHPQAVSHSAHSL